MSKYTVSFKTSMSYEVEADSHEEAKYRAMTMFKDDLESPGEGWITDLASWEVESWEGGD